MNKELMLRIIISDIKIKNKKMKKIIVIIMFITAGFAACKKSGITPPTSPKNYADFLKNTEWVGVLDRNGYHYPPPCCLKFNADNTITVYAPFWFNDNGVYVTPDSINGKIKSIDSLPDERTSIKVSFPYINDQTIYITNRQKLISVSTDPNKPTTFQLELFPVQGISVKGTTWSGPLMSGSGAASGQFAYPDLSSIVFLGNKDVTVYYRNGQPVPAQPTPQSPGPGALEAVYQQRGAMVFMSGYKENGIILMDYFGVLLPSGDKMMVHSGSPEARLPNYLQTIAWYGPIGATPIIHKK
jgi:hypothetical protein